jgi:hypothetical protein
MSMCKGDVSDGQTYGELSTAKLVIRFAGSALWASV